MKKAKQKVIDALEGLTKVQCSVAEYLQALREVQDEADAWLEAAIDAAQYDVRREEER